MNYRRNKYDEEIEKYGRYSLGIVKGKMVSKGNVCYIEYFYIIKGEKHEFERNVEDNFYKTHRIGDTIIVKILPSNLSQSIICQDESYRICYGKQPEDGWKKLPSCKCGAFE